MSGLSWMWRIGLCAVFAVFLAGMVAAQISSRVELTIEPAPSRGNTAWFDVRLRIPAGYFVPAESRGALKGAWLQPLTPWFSRQLPTYPIPSEVRLPGSDRPVLAYSGTVVVRMPVDAGLTGVPEVRVRLGYELCDSRACSRFATAEAKAKFAVPATPANHDLLGYRIDSQRVAIVTAKLFPVSREAAELVRPLAQFIPELRIVSETHSARSAFIGDLAMGAHWTISSNGARFAAAAEQPAIASYTCEGNEAPLVIIARVPDRRFANNRAKYFLASRSGRGTNPQSLSVDLRLDDTQRLELEDVINKQRRITVPTAFAPDPYNHDPSLQSRETEYDRRVRQGQGKLIYHLEAFKLAPDEDPRLYVRAYWTADSKAETGLTLWMRFDGHHFQVEQADAGITRFARIELVRTGTTASRADYAGMLLNVIAADDGWAYIIMGQQGYEGQGVWVYKYSPTGPREAGIEYRFGC
jgi:hypothetical protein